MNWIPVELVDQAMAKYRLKHCPEMCDGEVSTCLCKYQCMWGHCGHTRDEDGDCCLCGWSPRTDPARVAERREITFFVLGEMGFSL